MSEKSFPAAEFFFVPWFVCLPEEEVYYYAVCSCSSGGRSSAMHAKRAREVCANSSRKERGPFMALGRKEDSWRTNPFLLLLVLLLRCILGPKSDHNLHRISV